MKTITPPRITRDGVQAPTAAFRYIATERTHAARHRAGRVFAMVDYEGIGAIALEDAGFTQSGTATVVLDGFQVAPGQEPDLFSLACDVLQAWANDNASLEKCAAFLAEQVPGLAKEKTR